MSIIKAYAVKSPSGELLSNFVADTETGDEWKLPLLNQDRGHGHRIVPVTIVEGHEHPAIAALREVRDHLVAKYYPHYPHAVCVAVAALTAKIEELSK